MNLERGFKRITWVLSIIVAVCFAIYIWGMYDVQFGVFFTNKFGEPFATIFVLLTLGLFGLFTLGLLGFCATWFIYFLFRWIIKGFKNSHTKAPTLPT